jgi:hypothetical protein
MRTERSTAGGFRRHRWTAALRGLLAAALLVVTSASLWHEHSGAHALDQGDRSCVTCHAAQGLGTVLASAQHSFTLPRISAPAPCASLRAPHRHRHTLYSARGPPVFT